MKEGAQVNFSAAFVGGSERPDRSIFDCRYILPGGCCNDQFIRYSYTIKKGDFLWIRQTRLLKRRAIRPAMREPSSAISALVVVAERGVLDSAKRDALCRNSVMLSIVWPVDLSEQRSLRSVRRQTSLFKL